MEERDLKYIITAHSELAKEPKKRVRYWDQKTPYYVHPIWCSSTLLQETSLPDDIRLDGSSALLYHDVLEDTNAKLPYWLSDNVKGLISKLTFKSSEEAWKTMWKEDKVIRLLKLYDAVSNLMDSVWMKPKKRKKHIDNIEKLCKDVESNYGELNIVKIAKGLV